MANPSHLDRAHVDNPTRGGEPAEASEPDEPQLEPPPVMPPAERIPDAGEYGATELARLRRNYSRASSYHHQGSSTASKKPTTGPQRFIYGLKKFWRRQISIVVDHHTCRDHLGQCRSTCGYLIVITVKRFIRFPICNQWHAFIMPKSEAERVPRDQESRPCLTVWESIHIVAQNHILSIFSKPFRADRFFD